MAKKSGQSGPPGKRRPQRNRRPGRAGIGPGPAYKPSSSGGGTSHKGGKTSGGMCRFGRLVGAVILGCFAAAFVGTALAAIA